MDGWEGWSLGPKKPGLQGPCPNPYIASAKFPTPTVEAIPHHREPSDGWKWSDRSDQGNQAYKAPVEAPEVSYTTRDRL